MNQKPPARQQNITSWILLITMVLLAGIALYLRQNPAPAPAPTPAAVESSAPAQPSAADGWWGDVILAVQVAIFAGALGYFIGYTRGQRREAEKHRPAPPKFGGDKASQ